MRIPVDYVAGTSMGAIVGALFAIGLTPDQIEAEMMAVDWDDLFSDKPAREKRTFRRKQDDSSYFLPIEFGLAGRRIVLAPGMIAGQKLAFAFPNPDFYLAGRDGFDNLAYPFRPVATDLGTGEMVVLERGNLLKAVRASMSIPGVFPPVEWEGRELVDGYLARNLPVDVVRAMGADIVIAVDVGALPDSTSRDELRSLVGIAEQTSLIQARQNVLPQLAAADVVIHPDLQGISSRDFQRVGATIAPGDAAARAVADRLQDLALTPQDYARHLAAHTIPAPGAITIDEVVISNNSSVDDATIRRQIRQREGQYLYLHELEEDLTRIYDFGVFELVDFQLSRAPTAAGDSTTLTVVAKRKFYEPNILNFGLAYTGGEAGHSELSVRLRVTSLELTGWGGELRTDVQLGETDALRAEFYQPLSWTRRPFAALRLTVRSQVRAWYYDMVKWGDYLEKEQAGELHLGWRLGQAGELRGGLMYGHIRTRDTTGLSLAEFEGPRGGYVVEAAADVMNAAVFPTHGSVAQARLFFASPDFGSGLDYTRLEGLVRTVFTTRGNSVEFGARGGSGLGTDLPEFDLFTAGGLGRLGGYSKDQLRGEAYAIASLGWYRHLGGRGSPYSTQWYAGALVEAGNAWLRPDEASLGDLRGCGSIFLGARTLLGPLLLTYARALDGNDAVYITLGHVYGFLD
jgi:NTE family protein